MKRFAMALFFILALLAAAILWMAGGVQSERTFASEPVTFSDVATTTSTQAEPTAEGSGTKAHPLRVLVWNIAWGYGWGSEGTGKARPREHFEMSLQRIGELIRATQADLVLLQEIDFGATRSGEIDQLHAIARHAGLPHAAYAPSWEANWVPFPYWPPSEHFGRMRSGGAILSRFPILRSEVQLFPKPAEQPWWYNLFYLFRYLQRAELSIAGREVTVYNTHLEAFHAKTRMSEARLVAALLEKQGSSALIFGGDLNAPPPEALQKNGYPDETRVKTSHDHDTTVAIVRGVPGLSDSVPETEYRSRESSWFTFPSHEPNRMLDHLFYGQAFERLDARVVTEAGDVSDHLPLMVRLVFKEEAR